MEVKPVILGEFFVSRPPRRNLAASDLVTFLGMEDIAEGGGVLHQTTIPARQVKVGLTSFESNDVLVAKITPCFENGKGAYLDGLETQSGFGSTEFHVLRAKAEVDSRYVYFHTQSGTFRRKLTAEMIGSAGQKRVPISAIEKYELLVRHLLSEQRAIADALSDVDGLLGGLDRLIAKKRDLKQAAMQQLLTGQIRLPSFKGEWVEKTLGDIGRFKNGLNKDSSAFGHGSPFVNLMDVFGVNAISATGHLGLVASTKMDKEVYYLRQGDVLFIRSSVKPSGVGLTVVVERDLIDTVYSGFLIRFRDDGTLDNGFKKHCFYAETFRKKLIAASSVSANTNINQNALGTLTLLLPPTTEEQIAIATVLSDMDMELAALEQRRDKTRSLKQGMMQELLTGRTRLV